MYIKMNEREQKLLDLLTAIPPDMVGAAYMLQTEHLDCDEVTKVAIGYAYECFCEAGDFAYEHRIPHPAAIVPNLHSTYILDIIKLLLRYGLDPNGVHEDDNIMNSLRFVDNELIAADTLVLLLGHGGKTDLIIPGEGDTLFNAADFAVFYDAVEQYDRQRYASLVHCWMVMIGYGARCGEDKMQAFRECNSTEPFDWDKLKKHRNYYFGITHLENDFAISIYDKDTLWEVARIK